MMVVTIFISATLCDIDTVRISMQKIIPHLWYDKEAKEAAEFYTSIFGGTRAY